MRKLFLGVDGGGTRTRAVLVDAELRVLGAGEGGPSNAAQYAPGRVMRSVLDAIGGALAEGGVALESVYAAGLGLAGVAAHATHGSVITAARDALRTARVRLETDARAALAAADAADPDAPGIVVIAGTGSVAYGRTRAGDEARAGGFGWLIGDEGSGFWIARRGLEAAARSLDGRAPHTAVLERLAESYGVRGYDELIQIVYKSGVLPGGVAALFPAVLAAALAGDAAAMHIFREAADELARAAGAVAAKLGAGRGELRVAYTGGVFDAAAPLRAAFGEALAAEGFSAAAAPLAYSPQIGAARLAMAAFAEERP